MSRKIVNIEMRAKMAAQMAVAVRTEAKSLLKSERRKHGIPVYYAQNLATMISRAVEMTGQTSSASLAALELGSIQAANALAESAAYQALSTKSMYKALVIALEESERV